jgi:transcriptional regulator with XRE-family HTH domain
MPINNISVVGKVPESIGERIKLLRTEQGMTLAELGEKVSLSASHLSQIERDKTAPSLSTLMDIAHALKVGPRYFFETEVDVAYIQRAGKEKDKHAPVRPVDHQRLTPGLRSNKLEVCKVILQPHTTDEPLELFSGEGFCFVLSGELTIRVGNEQFVLAAGDSIHFDAFQPHNWSNAGDHPCAVIWGRAASLQDH